jgi:hypothetical protein
MKDTSMSTGRWRLTADELPPPGVPLIIAWKKGKRMMIDHDAAYDPKGKLKRENWSRPGDVDFFPWVYVYGQAKYTAKGWALESGYKEPAMDVDIDEPPLMWAFYPVLPI